MEAPATLRIEYMALAYLLERVWPGNPRKHSQAAIRNSILNHGMRLGLAFDPTTERLVAGHGRLNEIGVMFQEGLEPPLHIHAVNGDWMIPVQVGEGFVDEAAAERFLLADNTTTDDAGYLNKELAAILERQLGLEQVEETGFDRETAEAMVNYAQFKADEAALAEKAAEEEKEKAMWDGKQRGLNPKEKLEIYEKATIKQIVIHLELEPYAWAQEILLKLRQDLSLPTNTLVFIYLLEQHADNPCPAPATESDDS